MSSNNIIFRRKKYFIKLAIVQGRCSVYVAVETKTGIKIGVYKRIKRKVSFFLQKVTREKTFLSDKNKGIVKTL